MKKLHVLAWSTALLGMSAVAYGAGDAEAGKAKAATCAACHGVDGNSVNPQWPKLAGQHAAYLTIAMKAYKSGDRKNPMMSPMAAPLSDEDIENLAAFFSSQKQK